MLAVTLDISMPRSLTDLSYLAAAVLFIIALKAMGSHRTARRGNLAGAAGMLVAVVFAVLASGAAPLTWVIIGLVAGAAVGTALALKVHMTAMPQMVALLNGLGGLASALVVIAEFWRQPAAEAATDGRFVISVAVSTVIGWVTFSGSLVAFAKLQEVVLKGRPVVFRFQKAVNLAALVAAVVLMVLLAVFPQQRWLLAPLAVLAAGVGVLGVIPIGGADMPVVISLLNSYSGLAAAATGFVLSNTGLIVAGALVGASGIVLTRAMCVAMNRSLANVLFGAVGAAVAAEGAERKTVKGYTAEDAAMALEGASLVIVVPGYGLAVAQAQHAVKDLADLLADKGVTVKFGIHPVAGRMPGHMNVLLAEAEVPYEQLADLEAINPEFERCDAALVIGANDVVNPGARHDQGSPIYGMPILNVDHARTVMICKRSLSPGFAGVDNELFYDDKTMMLFGDAKQTATDIVAALKDA